MKSLPFEPKLQQEEIEAVANNISAFLTEYDVAHHMAAVCSEKEWTDFRVAIEDPGQMERINTWLKDDLVSIIKEHGDIEVSAPNPLEGKENQLRIRIYALDTNV